METEKDCWNGIAACDCPEVLTTQTPSVRPNSRHTVLSPYPLTTHGATYSVARLTYAAGTPT